MSDSIPTPIVMPPVAWPHLERFARDERAARTTGQAGDATHARLAQRLEAAIATHSPTPAGARILIGGSRLDEDGSFDTRGPDALEIMLSGLASLERAGIRPRQIVEDGSPGVAAFAYSVALYALMHTLEVARAEEVGPLTVLAYADALVWVDDGSRLEILRAAHESGGWVIWAPPITHGKMRAFVGVRRGVLEITTPDAQEGAKSGARSTP